MNPRQVAVVSQDSAGLGWSACSSVNKALVGFGLTVRLWSESWSRQGGMR